MESVGAFRTTVIVSYKYDPGDADSGEVRLEGCPVGSASTWRGDALAACCSEAQRGQELGL